MKMNNRWNRIIYRLWAPVYDAAVGGFFMAGRKRAMALAGLRPGERVLLVGVGTGADLLLMPAGVSAVCVDLSPEMLAQAQKKLSASSSKVILMQGDAQKLLVEPDSFDVAIFNLILSVIPDGAACLRENFRALKPGGRAVVFDKFLPNEGRLTMGRRVVNWGSTLLGTDITRRFGDLCHEVNLEVISNEPSLMGGMYRVILLRKPGDRV